MPVIVPRRAINAVAASADPKKEILSKVGDISGIRLIKDEVLLGIYIRPEKTSGGIIRPDVNVEEDVWQGKVGLTLRFGIDAFKDTPDYTFSETPKLDEWVVYFVGDARSVTVNGYPCRLVRDINIRMIVSDPNIVF